MNNKKIIFEILNEEKEMESYATGYEMFHIFNQAPILNNDIKKLSWKLANVERTFFGEGYVGELLEKNDDEGVDNIMAAVTKAFILASLRFNKSPNNINQPLLMLAETLAEIYEKDLDLDVCPEYFLRSYLPLLIDCESLAPWLLVSELRTNDDLV